MWEFLVILVLTLGSWSRMFANLTGLNEQLYRSSDSEIAQSLLSAMQNPTTSLKQGNLISLWTLDSDIENTFAKWYCTYGAARVSPEFFPFMDPKTQQRTWWGNAVDRCKNASDTWYKIWMTPTQWALIVYNAGGRFWSYGHVGKVMHVAKSINKLIVRDMARVARGTMSDRREDLATANIKCYIYNSKTSILTEPPVDPVVPTVPVPIPPTVITPTVPIVPTLPTTPVHTAPTTPTVVTPIVPVIVTPTPPTIPVVVVPTISQNSINKKLDLNFDELIDIAKHFMTQNNVVIHLVSKSPLQLGEVATLTLEITNKDTGEKYSGLLPFAFTILLTNDALQPSMSNIKLINDGSVGINILAQKIGTATIVISIDDIKIGEFSFDVK